MRLISIELSGYERISLSGNYIKITPTADLQLILGTNGSGKSSLLDEITPLPSDAKSYTKGGFSIKTFEHKGSIYVLKSIFDKKQEHYFEKDGIELNPGRTVTVQKELVRQEFGITAEIHELIIGRDKFTQMPPSRKRYWFTQLSSVSYDYAIEVYNRVREKLRDTTGALKIMKNRLVTESAKSILPEQQQQLKNEVSELHDFLSHISEYRKPIEKPINKADSEIIELSNRTSYISNQLISRINKIKLSNNYGSLDNVCSLINQLNNEQTVNKLLIEKLHERIKKVSDNIDILIQTGNQGIEDLENKVSSLKKDQISLVMSKKIIEDTHKSPTEAIRAIEICKTTLDSIFAEIPSNGDLRYSTGSKNKLIDELGKTKDKVDKLRNELIKYNRRKEHLEEHRDKSNMVCPHCSKNINFVFSIAEYEQINHLIAKHSDEIQSLLKYIEQLEIELKEINDYIEIYNRYRTIRSSYPALNQLWEIIDNKIITIPSNCNSIVQTFHSDLLADKKYIEIDTEINDIQKLIVAKKLIGDQDANKLKHEREQIEQEIFDKQLTLEKTKLELSKLTEYKKDLEIVQKLEKELNELSKDLQITVDDKVESMRRQVVIEGIRYVQSILSRKESILLDLNNQENIIKDLQRSIAILEDDEYCLKSIVAELSPTDGLIAEGLFGFIKLFVSQMNSFISKVWTYEMKILSCELSDDSKIELDYKFPIHIEGKEKPVPDVGLGSESMLEIIDLAFKIVAIKHLGLSDIPLFLDEFGAKFDKVHRTAVYGVFDYLMNQIQFNQVFIVNHYSDLYGSFKNAEICVLHDSNVEIPKGSIYNKHVSIA